MILVVSDGEKLYFIQTLLKEVSRNRMAETQPETPLIGDHECKCEKQTKIQQEVVPPDGGFWVSLEIV